MTSRGVITSDGKILNLDEDNGISNLSPENIVSERRTYGMEDSLSFISRGHGQWYDTTHGWWKLQQEYKEMDKLSFDFWIKQQENFDVGYLILIPYNGLTHEVLITYDYDHPNYEMSARILKPTLDRLKMGTHVYRNGNICYIHNWNRGLRAIHVAAQVAFWIKDCWDGKLVTGRTSFQPSTGIASTGITSTGIASLDKMLRAINESGGFQRIE